MLVPAPKDSLGLFAYGGVTGGLVQSPGHPNSIMVRSPSHRREPIGRPDLGMGSESLKLTQAICSWGNGP